MPPYRYTNDFDARGWTGSIGDMLRLKGEIPADALRRNGLVNARAAEQQGAITANAIHDITQAAVSIPGQIQENKRAAQVDEARGLQLDETKRKIGEAKTLSELIRATPKVDLGDGVFGYDIPTITEAIAAKGGDPALATSHLGPVNESFQQAAATRMAAVKRGALGIQAGGNDPGLAGDYLDLLERNQIYPPATLARFRSMATTPEGVAKITASILGPQKVERAAPGSVAIGPDGKPIEGTQVPERPVAPTQASLAAAAAAGDPKAQAALDLLRPKPEAKRYPVTVPGPDGKPVQKLFTEEELAQGVQAYREPKEPRAADNDLVQVMGPNGAPIWMRKSEAAGQPAAQAPRAVTGAERGVLAFYNRAKDAVETLTEGGDKSLENQIAKQSLAGQLQTSQPYNLLQTSDQQRYRQAQRAFTEARLRKESGAAINASEYANDAKIYFAQPGDSAATMTQKREMRQTVLDGLKFSAGKAFEEYYGEPNVSPARAVKTPVQSTAPAVGTERVVNGTPAIWDGKGWKAK